MQEEPNGGMTEDVKRRLEECRNDVTDLRAERWNHRTAELAPFCDSVVGCGQMKSVIAVANQKGGVAKTTSAAALGVLLSRKGIPTHLIDADPQSDLTTAFGQYDADGLLYEALLGHEALPVAKLGENLTLTPSSIDLTRGESNFMAEHGREFLLQEAIRRTEFSDDTIVIIDCPPSLGLLTVNCLAAANWLLVPEKPGRFEMKALRQLMQTVLQLKRRINPGLELLGVMLTNADMRKKITLEVEREVKRAFPVLGMVRQDARLEDAAGRGVMLELLDSHAMDEYRSIAEKLTKTVWQETKTRAKA